MTDQGDESKSGDEPATPVATDGGDGNDHAESDGPGTVVRRDRFSGGPARDFLSSLSADERLFAADLAVDRAHVVMLAEQSIVDDEDAGAILAALAQVEAAGHAALPDGEDVHEAIETAVIEGIAGDGAAQSNAAEGGMEASQPLVEGVGPAGGRMHTARSRNDEVATCIRYRLREDLLATLETVVESRAALLDSASEHTETVMPGYTHLQPAQPTTVGHWLCSYEGALARDTERLLDAYDRVDRCPLGAAAFAGTTFHIDRERTAELLGFSGVVENAMDAVSTRDFLVESTAAVATLATTLSGLAEDAVLFAHDGHLDVADEYASTSSIMPQKKNPDTLELVRGRTGDATGGLTGLLTTLKGLPRAYNRDLQRAGRHTWDAIDSVTAATEVAVGAVTTAEWDIAEMEAAAGEGFATATGIADLLAQAGVPFRTAHEVVAHAAGSAEDPDVDDIDAATRAVLGESIEAYVDRETLESFLDPAESVASRNSRGGPAPATVAAHCETAREAVEADRTAVAAHRRTLADAADQLDGEVARYV